MSDDKPVVKVCANDDGNVFMMFKEPVCFISLTAEQANKLAVLLIKKAGLSLLFKELKRKEELIDCRKLSREPEELLGREPEELLGREPSIDHAAIDHAAIDHAAIDHAAEANYYVMLNCCDEISIKPLTDDDGFVVVFNHFRQAHEAAMGTELGELHGFKVYDRPPRRG